MNGDVTMEPQEGTSTATQPDSALPSQTMNDELPCKKMNDKETIEPQEGTNSTTQPEVVPQSHAINDVLPCEKMNDKETIEPQEGTNSTTQPEVVPPSHAINDVLPCEKMDDKETMEPQEGTATQPDSALPSQVINDVLPCEKMKVEGNMEPQEETNSATQPDSVPSAENNIADSATAHSKITPTLLEEIRVKTHLDKYSCFIAGMAILAPDRLVLSDYVNKSIKLVDINKRAVTSQLPLGICSEDRPSYITATTNKQVAVSIPGRQLIKFIYVSHTLRKTNEIRTNGQCFGLHCYQNKLIVTYRGYNRLEILNMKGKLIMRVKLPSAGEGITHAPDCIQANDRGIYVSDNHYVIMLNWEGEITGTFTGMVDPTSISLLDDGSLIVCGFKNGGLCQMSADGTYQGLVLKDVIHPTTTCVDNGRRELYISRFTNGLDEVSNSILVYSI